MAKIWDEEAQREVDELIAPSLWSPKDVGECVAGRVIEINVGGRYGIEATLLVDDLKPEGVLLPAHSLLQAKISMLAVGDLVKVTYQGHETAQSGREARVYKVERGK